MPVLVATDCAARGLDIPDVVRCPLIISCVSKLRAEFVNREDQIYLKAFFSICFTFIGTRD